MYRKRRKKSRSPVNEKDRRQKVLHAYHDELEWDDLRRYVEEKAAKGRILFVDNVAVDIDQILERQFVCDGRRCIVWRGDDEKEALQDNSCCSRYGVPISAIGEKRIVQHLDAIVAELPEEHPIKGEKGFSLADIFFYDERQRSMLMSGDLGACVFSFYEDGRSYCAIHRAAMKANQSPASWKPLTCLLWPLAVDRYKTDDGNHNWIVTTYSEETDDVFEQEADGSTPVPCIVDDDEEYPYVYESMRDELEQLFGREWYRKLLKSIDKHIVAEFDGKDDAVAEDGDA